MHRPGAKTGHANSAQRSVLIGPTCRSQKINQPQQQHLQYPMTPKSPQVAALRDRPAAAVSKQNNNQQLSTQQESADPEVRCPN